MSLTLVYLHDFIKQHRLDFQVFKVANVTRGLDGLLFLMPSATRLSSITKRKCHICYTTLKHSPLDLSS